MTRLEVRNPRIGKIKGASPSEDRFYVMVLFDISDAKKYRRVIRILKGYGHRIQYSVFEAYVKSAQIRELTAKLTSVMASKRFYDPDDKVRIYRIASNCELTVLGKCVDHAPENDVFV
ncbi:CRISPR-associated endonuclease Cas2 [Gordonibacter sp. An230]|uniref:CRISPR-associated endonuclease Cas2 n=1 Tax=Gordonibacter sp. An230 TaxID=1965592 RepID=UPI000B37BB55|nr:CRISPR-associated endonuclease Cas2 [Gordonibacter sp. An230]OUO91759.1 CRISPR-associated endonuclease Cas2 [Gordonibacter sp. An230]